jgi:hypothetical protein
MIGLDRILLPEPLDTNRLGARSGEQWIGWFGSGRFFGAGVDPGSFGVEVFGEVFDLFGSGFGEMFDEGLPDIDRGGNALQVVEAGVIEPGVDSGFVTVVEPLPHLFFSGHNGMVLHGAVLIQS